VWVKHGREDVIARTAEESDIRWGGVLRKRLFLKRWFALFLALALLSNLRAEHFPWPDFDHWRYGLPLLWLTHQVSSIAGPVDRWFLDMVSLTIDMLLWALTALGLTYLLERRSP
jgi:hypothetical protein